MTLRIGGDTDTRTGSPGTNSSRRIRLVRIRLGTNSPGHGSAREDSTMYVFDRVRIRANADSSEYNTRPIALALPA